MNWWPRPWPGPSGPNRATSGKRESTAKLELPHPWTEEEREDIDDQIMNMKIRGAEVLYWEDVKVGDEVPQVVKGPIGITDEAAFYGGTSGRLMAHEAALRGYKKHPAWGFRAGDTTGLGTQGGGSLAD